MIDQEAQRNVINNLSLKSASRNYKMFVYICFVDFVIMGWLGGADIFC